MPTCAMEIVDGASRFCIEVLGKPYASSSDRDDVEWLRCNVEARAAGFGGSLSCNLKIAELELLRASLVELLERKREFIQFAALEAFLELDVAQNSRGSFDLHVVIMKHDESAMRFEFSAPGVATQSIVDFSEGIRSAAYSAREGVS